jgi:DNA-binding response OmpR family regulator
VVHHLGEVEVDVGARLVRRGESAVVLTPKAFDLLLALIARRGRVVSRHELLRDVWGYDASITTRTVDAHVAELRRKLATLGAAELVATAWKLGYRLRE